MTKIHRLALWRGFALTLLVYWPSGVLAEVPPGWPPTFSHTEIYWPEILLASVAILAIGCFIFKRKS